MHGSQQRSSHQHVIPTSGLASPQLPELTSSQLHLACPIRHNQHPCLQAPVDPGRFNLPSPIRRLRPLRRFSWMAFTCLIGPRYSSDTFSHTSLRTRTRRWKSLVWRSIHSNPLCASRGCAEGRLATPERLHRLHCYWQCLTCAAGNLRDIRRLPRGLVDGGLGEAFAGAVIITLGMFFPCFVFTIAGHSLLEKVVHNQVQHLA